MGAELEHVAVVGFRQLLRRHDENESRNSHDKFIQTDGSVGTSFALPFGPEPNLDGAKKVPLTGERLEDDVEPVGVLELAVVLQQAHVSLHEVLVALGILESLVWDHMW